MVRHSNTHAENERGTRTVVEEGRAATQRLGSHLRCCGAADVRVLCVLLLGLAAPLPGTTRTAAPPPCTTTAIVAKETQPIKQATCGPTKDSLASSQRSRRDHSPRADTRTQRSCSENRTKTLGQWITDARADSLDRSWLALTDRSLTVLCVWLLPLFRHPEFVSKPPAENKFQEAAVAASGGAPAPVSHNTSGTKPLPIPFSQRPGYEEEQSAIAAAKRAAYEAFKAHQISSVGGDKIPADFHDHTHYSEEHVRSELKKGQIFRPSKPRVGTTPAERANATNELAASQHLAVSAAAVQDQEDREMQHRYNQRTQSQFQFRAGAGGMDRGMHMGGAGVRYVPAAMDESRPQRTNGSQPAYYNVPQRQQ